MTSMSSAASSSYTHSQSQGNFKLKPFLLIAKTTKGSAAIKVIQDATAANGIYGFGDLLSMPNINELKDDPIGAKAYDTLKLFAYGTYGEWGAHQDRYSELNQNQISKLRQLTLVSMGMKARSLPYDYLLASLSLTSIRELEDLIIECIYAGILGGKLDQKNSVLHIDWVIGRDVHLMAAEGKGGLREIEAQLRNWCTTASSLISSIDDRIAVARQSSANQAASQAEYFKRRGELLNNLESDALNKKNLTDGRGIGHADMEIIATRLRDTDDHDQGSNGTGEMEWNDSHGKGKQSAHARRKFGQRSSVDEQEDGTDGAAARQKPRRDGDEGPKRRGG